MQPIFQTVEPVLSFLGQSASSWTPIIALTTSVALTVFLTKEYVQRNDKVLIHNSTSDNLVKEKIQQAYAYTFAGLGITALAGTIAHVAKVSAILLSGSYLLGIPLAIGLFAGTATTVMATDRKIQTVAWVLTSAALGVLLSPVGFLGSAIVTQAAIISLGLGGILTLTAHLAPNAQFLKWKAPLAAGLTALTIASTVAWFFPATAFAYGVSRVSLYGGLAIFSGYLLYDSQRLYEQAKDQNKEFYPIKHAVCFQLDLANIFLRVVQILHENSRQEKKKS